MQRGQAFLCGKGQYEHYVLLREPSLVNNKSKK